MLVGPYLVYADYMDLINETMFKDVKTKPGRSVPSGRKRIAYRKLITGLVYLGTFVVFGGTYNFSLALTPWFAQKSFLFRYAAMLSYDVPYYKY